MTTARQKVINQLAKSRTASAREIARALKMSAATVRHHLRVMVADGRLEVESVRGREGRGRPEKVYSLPRAALGDNLSVLADVLLTEAGSKPALSGDGVVRMEALAKRLTADADLSRHPIARRLNSVVEKMNQMNYHARWEAGAEGPRILFGHCPYAAIIERHPELCDMDMSLISQLISRPVQRESKPETHGSWLCPYVFLIR